VNQTKLCSFVLNRFIYMYKYNILFSYF